MNKPIFLSILAASLLIAASTTASAQQRSTLEPAPGPGTQSGDTADVRALYSNILSDEELQRFQQMRQQAKTRAERNRIEAEESALLNERVAQRIAALQQSQQPTTPSTAERPPPAPDRMPPQQVPQQAPYPYDPGASEGSMGR
jgi:hypothetical protein